MDGKRAHIVIFGFNRPDHLRKCLDSLSMCEGFHSFAGTIFIDGPKNSEHISKVTACREIASNFGSRFNFEVISREKNLGLSQSVKYGLDDVFSKHDSAIIIEDDLLLHKDFLTFLQSGLNYYSDNLKVASISGFQYPTSIKLESGVFMKGADCWGWATWKNRWDLVNFNGKYLYSEIRKRKLTKDLNLGNSINFMKMLKQQIKGEVDSWAILWHCSMFLQNRFTYYPPVSLVQNIGMDGSGRHSGITDHYFSEIQSVSNFEFPDAIKSNNAYMDSLKTYYSQIIIKPSILIRVKTKLKLGILKLS